MVCWGGDPVVASMSDEIRITSRNGIVYGWVPDGFLQEWKLPPEDTSTHAPSMIVAVLSEAGLALAGRVRAVSAAGLQIVRFAWWDTGFTNRFELTALGPNGERHRLDPRWFAPYDMTFVQSRFYYLTKRAPLTGTFGVVFDHRIERALAEARPSDIEAVRERFATCYYHPVLAGAFSRFVTKTASGRKKRGGYWPHALAPPFHFQRLEPAGTFEPGMPLGAIEIAYEERFFDGTRFFPGHRGAVQTIPIP